MNREEHTQIHREIESQEQEKKKIKNRDKWALISCTLMIVTGGIVIGKIRILLGVLMMLWGLGIAIDRAIASHQEEYHNHKEALKLRK